MNIQKIEKPDDGWTIEYLKQYNFSFTNSNVVKCKNLVIVILNKNLPFFYIVNEEKKSKDIYINEEYIILLRQASRKNQFNYDMLQSIVAYCTIHTGNDIITQIEEHEKQWQEYQKKLYEQQQERERKQKEEQLKKERRKKEAYLRSQQKKEYNLTEDNGNGGIYGIYAIDGNNDAQLLYIGLTTRPFPDRWKEHADIITKQADIPKGMERLYLLLIDEYEKKQLNFKILVSFNKLSSNRPITQSEKEAMEMALIYYFHPPGNTSGTIVPYYFSDTEKEF